MAVVKAKKPTKKLKAGQKKKVNKWLVLGGVAAVALIGAIVVRFSSASSWQPVLRVTGDWSVTGYDYAFKEKGALTIKTMFIAKGKTYRVCVRGYSTGATTNTQVFGYGDTSNLSRLGVSVKQYGSGSELHCSKSFTGNNNRTFPGISKTSGSTLKVTAASIEILK